MASKICLRTVTCLSLSWIPSIAALKIWTLWWPYLFQTW